MISHRIINKRIKFLDAQGNPLSNSNVRVSQTDHSFLFGCGAFDFLPFVNEGKEEHKQITDSWLEIFNYGTLPFYWGRYEPVEGRTAYPETFAAANWLREKGVRVNATDENGVTALMGAALSGHTDTARLLIDKGAQVNAADEQGRTALYAAKAQGHAAIVDMLRAAGAKE